MSHSKYDELKSIIKRNKRREIVWINEVYWLKRCKKIIYRPVNYLLNNYIADERLYYLCEICIIEIAIYIYARACVRSL